MTHGYIYIMTNPALNGMVKLGYATNVEQRRKQLSTTALPYEYEVFATYETSGKLEDKTLHKLIDNLNPDLRVSQNREFYVMSPEDAYELLEAIAIISNTEDKLKLYKSTEPKATGSQKVKKPAINFYECGLKDGDELIFTLDPSVRVTVNGEHKVLYNGQLTSLSRVASDIKGYPVSGPSFFTYNGECVADIANRTQWKSY